MKTLLIVLLSIFATNSFAGELRCQPDFSLPLQLIFDVNVSEEGVLSLNNAEEFFVVYENEKRSIKINENRRMYVYQGPRGVNPEIIMQISVDEINHTMEEHDHGDEHSEEIPWQGVATVKMSKKTLDLMIKNPGLVVPSENFRWWPVDESLEHEIYNTLNSFCSYNE